MLPHGCRGVWAETGQGPGQRRTGQRGPGCSDVSRGTTDESRRGGRSGRDGNRVCKRGREEERSRECGGLQVERVSVRGVCEGRGGACLARLGRARRSNSLHSPSRQQSLSSVSTNRPPNPMPCRSADSIVCCSSSAFRPVPETFSCPASAAAQELASKRSLSAAQGELSFADRALEWRWHSATAREQRRKLPELFCCPVAFVARLVIRPI